MTSTSDHPRPGPDILLADDNELGRKLLTDLVTAALGLRMHVVEDGAQAVAFMRKALQAGADADIRPRCLSLNYFMPVMTGLDALHAIRLLEAQHGVSPTPAFAHSALLSDEQQEAFRALGVQTILRTPFPPWQYIDAVRDCLQAWQA